MDSAAKIAELPPLYYEARRYCEDHDLPAEEIGRVREWMAVREFRQRVEPYYRQAARIMNLVPGYTFDGQGYVRANLTLEQDKMLEQIQQLIDREAETLGLGARRQAARG